VSNVEQMPLTRLWSFDIPHQLALFLDNPPVHSDDGIKSDKIKSDFYYAWQKATFYFILAKMVVNSPSDEIRISAFSVAEVMLCSSIQANTGSMTRSS
ncbi:hypothetical protein J6590_090967, partial [Homalodisca vitripennis]